MAMVVKNNLSAKNTLNQLNKNEKATSKDLKKLASGMRINSAGDDASGLSISERMEVQLRSLEQDNQNSQNGASLLKTAEGAVQSTVEILRTLKEKAINAANDTNTDDDRATMQKEFEQSIQQIDENAQQTYNGLTLVDGSKDNHVPEPGTYTSLTNETLSSDTDAFTYMTDLKDSDGNSLRIDSSDTMTVSYVMNGKTQVASTKVGDIMINGIFRYTVGDSDIILRTPVNNTVGENEFGETVMNPSGKTALTFMAQQPGVDHQIAGLTITFQDRYGTAKRYANALFNNFRETVRAKDPSDDNAIDLQIGTKSNQAVRTGLTDMRSRALGLRSTDGEILSITSQEKANAAINVLDNALAKALNQQTDLGSVQSRLSYTSSNIVTASENTTNSMSVIRDADMAAEMTSYTKNNVLTQAAQSMLAQANQSSSSVLSLLQ
ncbi:flagellin [uncultured Selenomonas sp.]|uniref:flagellin n=1 Tax=uncultured Selenomonas sp. TaxID=159275 RepID=UPI0025D3BC1F|nr:flagellin [uncultured Selenomonas sp.]